MLPCNDFVYCIIALWSNIHLIQNVAQEVNYMLFIWALKNYLWKKSALLLLPWCAFLWLFCMWFWTSSDGRFSLFSWMCRVTCNSVQAVSWILCHRCRRFDDPEPFEVNARPRDAELYRQHPSSEPQLRRVQSRSRLETQQPTDDIFVSFCSARFLFESLLYSQLGSLIHLIRLYQ